MIIVRLLSPGLGWFAPPKFIPGLGAGIVMESITLKCPAQSQMSEMGIYRQSPHLTSVRIAGMKWLTLYALTALVTGLHNFYGLMSMVNGAPINLLNCISLLGSATLLVLLCYKVDTLD